MDGVHMGRLGIFQKGPSQGIWGSEVSSGVQGHSPSRESGDLSSPEAEAKMLNYVHFFAIGGELRQYFVQTHIQKKIPKIQLGGLNPPNPLPS